MPTLADEGVSVPRPVAPRRHVTLDVSVGLGPGSSTADREWQASGGLHLTVRPGPVVLAGDVVSATNVFGSGHLFATVGAGGSVPLRAGRLLLVGLIGRHRLEVVEFWAEPEEHDLLTAGARASWELFTGGKIEGRLSLAATCYVDLEREPDSVTGDKVGGVTALLSVAVGLGY